MSDPILGPKYDIRLGDLKPWHILRVTCLQCRRVANVGPALVDIEEKFACTESRQSWRCGQNA